MRSSQKEVLKSEEICGIYREKVFCVGCIYKNQCQSGRNTTIKATSHHQNKNTKNQDLKNPHFAYFKGVK